uniref:Rib_recp_KP_reg domain-containing protein n=2 Tax=Steinernema glaseri TaxID=37863 RepID=A0A1I8AL46_9BILA
MGSEIVGIAAVTAPAVLLGILFSLWRRLAKLKAANQRLVADKIAALKEKNDFMDHIKKADQEKHALTANLDSQKSKFEAAMTKKEQRLQKLTAENQTLVSELSSTRSHKASIEAQLATEKAHIKKLNKELDGRKVEQKAIQKELEGRKVEQKAVEKELADLRSVTENKLKSSEAKIAQFEKVVAELTQTNKELKEQPVVDHTAELDALKNELSEKEAVIASHVLNETRRSQRSAELIKKAEQQNQVLSATLDNQKAQFEATIKEKEQQLQELVIEKQTLLSEKNSACNEKASTEAQLTDLKICVEALSKELIETKTKREEILKELDALNIATEDNLQKSEAKIAQYEQDIAKLTQTNEDLKMQLAMAEQARISEQNKARSEKASTDSQLHAERTRVEELRNELDTRRAEREAINKELATLKSVTENKLQKSEAKIAQYEKLVAELTQTNEELKNRPIVDNTAEVDALKKELSKLKADAELSKKQLQEAMQNQLAEEKAACEAAQKKLMEEHAATEALQKALEELQNKFAEQEKEVSIQLKTVEVQKKVIESLRVRSPINSSSS